MFDYSLGDPLWGGFWDGFFGSADVTDSWLSDFDNASPFFDEQGDLVLGADVGCLVGVVLTDTLFGCTPYLGDIEVGVAGGDSGGPQFINGRLASVTSYGLSFGREFGDISCLPNDEPPPEEFCLNSSFGEFSGYVPVYAHRDWLKSVIPEPATWAMMIAGFGLVGGMARRRRAQTSA
ncbi:MAG: PEPxxWA-CTERM sorting domain-containing protein [Sandaracinobacteroides sp.]